MTRPTYTEINCKAALNRVRGMPFNWSLNPYRGCTHACHYCYARASHAFHGMNAGTDFETKILVKTNLPEVLRRELSRPSWTGETVAVGTATDPYQPCEGRYRLTRRALEVLRNHRNPVSIVTKSTLVLRDADLLAELAAVAAVRVYVTVTTLDRELWRAVEPGTPPPAQRLLAVRRLNDASVPAGVLMAPVLPGLTDGEAAIDALAAAAAAHGAVSFGGSALRLAPLVKEHYLGFLAGAFPGLVGPHERTYAGPNAPAPYVAAIDRRLARARARHGFAPDPRRARAFAIPVRAAAPPPSGTQLPLAL